MEDREFYPTILGLSPPWMKTLKNLEGTGGNAVGQARGVAPLEKIRPGLSGALAAEATHLLTGELRHFGRYLGSKLLGVMVQTPAMYLSGWG